MLPTINDSAYRQFAGEPSVVSTTGRGRSTAHHGELLQGAFRDSGGTVRRGLVTMPCHALVATATFVPTEDNRKGVEVEPQNRLKARRAAELTLATLGLPHVSGSLTVTSNIPVGLGLGSSTADVVAAIRAVADAFGVLLPALAVARLAVAAETASDSIMFDGATVLFAQRDATVLETFAAPLPPLLALGVDTDPGATIDTLTLPPVHWTEGQLDAYALLRGLVRRAISTSDAKLLGRVATESAKLNQSILKTARLQDLIEVGERCGGVGVQISHSGTVASLLFDANDPGASTSRRTAERVLVAEGFAVTLTFAC